VYVQRDKCFSKTAVPAAFLFRLIMLFITWRVCILAILYTFTEKSVLLKELKF